MKIRFVTAASEEFADVIRYYQTAAPAAGVKFLERVEQGFQLIERFPALCPGFKGVHRKFRPAGSPCGNFNVIETKEIVDYAVLNLQQHPAGRGLRLGGGRK